MFGKKMIGGGYDDEDEDTSSESKSESAKGEDGDGDSYKKEAAAQLARILGVPDDKMERFSNALSAYVSACME